MLYRVGIPTTQRTLRKTKGVHGFVVQDSGVSRYLIAHEWLHSEALRMELSIIQISTYRYSWYYEDSMTIFAFEKVL